MISTLDLGSLLCQSVLLLLVQVCTASSRAVPYIFTFYGLSYMPLLNFFSFLPASAGTSTTAYPRQSFSFTVYILTIWPMAFCSFGRHRACAACSRFLGILFGSWDTAPCL